MDWGTIFKFIVAVLVSLGGVTGIAVALIKFGGDRLAEMLSARYQHKLDEQLETYKGSVDKKVYISKARFDQEFAVYQELTSLAYDLTYVTWDVLTAAGIDLEKCVSTMAVKQTDFVRTFCRNEILIRPEIATKLEEISEASLRFNVTAQNDLAKYLSYARRTPDAGRASVPDAWCNPDARDRMQADHDFINSEHSKLVDIIRNYLDSLEIR
ncbi:MAG: hypothetical protein FWF25_06795 [Propionibacteriaceae bacterium]|nr:hypothetical protein [Propionibacteriaceae bacterium]